MISHEHKCIFIHIPKCAGESVETALMGRPNWGKDDLNYKLLDLPQGSPAGDDKHYTINKWRNNENFKKYFKFSIVRNPWSAAYSFYKYRKKIDHFPHEFGDWVSCVNPKLWKDFMSPLRYLRVENEIAVDYIAKFENLKIEWAYLCGRMNIENKALPHKNDSTNRENYRDHYNKKTRDFIYLKMKEDIDFFKYDF